MRSAASLASAVDPAAALSLLYPRVEISVERDAAMLLLEAKVSECLSMRFDPLHIGPRSGDRLVTSRSSLSYSLTSNVLRYVFRFEGTRRLQTVRFRLHRCLQRFL